jgi:aminoglycoside phosphotransferase (APT) family kinase protein
VSASGAEGTGSSPVGGTILCSAGRSTPGRTVSVSALPPEGLADRLLGYLKDVLDSPALAYATPPSRLTGGFDTAVFGFELVGAPPAFEGPLVLRLFQDADGPRRARFEAAVQRAVSEQGYPAPRVLHVETEAAPLGNAFFIMARVRGVTALEAALRPGTAIFRLPGLVGRLHARLHACDAARAIEVVREAGFPDAAAEHLEATLANLEKRVAAAGLAGLLAGFRWLQAHQPQPARRLAICHGDFHPLNILVDRGQVTGVIDWAAALIADPARDVGCTRMIILCGPQELSRVERALFEVIRRWSAWRYEAAYRGANPVPGASVRYYEALRCFEAMLHASEIRTGQNRMQGEYAWSDPHAVKAAVALFRKNTGVVLELPPAPGG